MRAGNRSISSSSGARLVIRTDRNHEAIHILDDPCVSPRVRRRLDSHGWRSHLPLAADRIRELALVHCADRSPRSPTADELSFLTDFEQRYGGLRYQVLGGNAMEHGLDGEVALYKTEFGVTLPAILDGAWTSRVHILPEGRTMMREGRGPLRIARMIDASLTQRIEHHALLAEVGRWPHCIFTLVLPARAEPEVVADHLPTPVPEATGPANRWWFDGERAVFAHLRSWWGRLGGESAEPSDVWGVWCFTRDEAELDDLASRCASAITGVAQLDEDWCSLCGDVTAAGRHRLPGGAPTARVDTARH